jgi:phosphatidylinositol alpha-1,6-mannosyltransferase
MVIRKNMVALIRAFPAVLQRFPDAWLVLAGKGPERESLKLQALKSGVGDRILFPEVKPHAEFIREYGASIYCLADVFAMVSLASKKDLEGFGIVYLEAGACEIPVIGSRVGGIPDAVLEGETGVLVDPESPIALKEALIEMLSRPDRGKSMGVVARQRILNELNWQASADQLLRLME